MDFDQLYLFSKNDNGAQKVQLLRTSVLWWSSWLSCLAIVQKLEFLNVIGITVFQASYKVNECSLHSMLLPTANIL